MVSANNIKKIESLKRVVVLTKVKNMMSEYFDQCYGYVIGQNKEGD